MAKYYWNATTGNDSNDGSVGAPYLTFNAANPAATVAALASGDVISLTGMFRPDISSAALFNAFDGLKISGKSNITVTSGNGSFVGNGVSHAASISVPWFTADDIIYTGTVATGLSVAAIAVNFSQTRNDILGNPTVYTGILREAALIGDVSTTTNSWFYDSATGVITINCPNANPNSQGAYVCLQTDEQGIKFTSGSNNTVQNLTTELTGFESNTGGYGVQGDSCTNMLVQNMRIIFGGYHGVGFIGTTNNSNKIKNSYFYGAGNVNHTQTVHYTQATRNVIGGIVDNCYFSIYGPVDPSGVMHTGYTGISATYCHTTTDDASKPRVQSYDCTNCTYVSIADSAGTLSTGTACSGSDPLSMPSTATEERTFSSYNIRYSDCQIYGALKFGGGGSGSAVNTPLSDYPGGIAFRRIKHSTTAIVNPYNTGVVWVGWASTPAVGGNPKQCTQLLESCEFNFDLQAGGNFVLFFGGVTDNSSKKQIFIDCTVIDSTARTGNAFSYAVNASIANANVNKFILKGCIYYKDHSSTRSLFAGKTDTTNATILTTIDATNNWYYNTGGTLNYVNNTVAAPNMDSQAEYQAAMDPNGIFAVLPQFTNSATNGEPLAGGNIRSNKNSPLTPTPGNGINSRKYARNYGAYQYPSGSNLRENIRPWRGRV